MTTILYAKDQGALVKGARALLLAGPSSTFGAKRLEQVLPTGPLDLIRDLASDVKPGAGGAVASTLTGGNPRRVVVGLLPGEGSRHNSPARADAIENVVRKAGLAGSGKGAGKDAILLVLDEEAHVLPALNAVAKAFSEFSRKSGESSNRRVQVCAVNPQGEPYEIPETVRVTVESTREAARLVDTPPTEMNPAAVVREARALLRGIKNVKVKELSGDALLDAKLGGLHAVGRTGLIAPRLMIATYTPAHPVGAPVALVGKGITYDTGGLSLKIGGNMVGMKSDMGGSAAVLGAFRVLAAAGIQRKLFAVLALAENAIGPDAYKPDDILEMHSGKTVEVNNTDAEGRIVLGDAVSYAARELGAEILIDAATLTGAQLIATGNMHAALVSNDAELEAVLIAAGRATGDLVHPLPFAPEFYKQEFKSKVADMRNSVKNRMNAQSSCAAQFIYNHLDDTKARWAHVDLAGPAWIGDRGTGYGVALLSEAVRRLEG